MSDRAKIIQFPFYPRSKMDEIFKQQLFLNKALAKMCDNKDLCKPTITLTAKEISLIQEHNDHRK